MAINQNQYIDIKSGTNVAAVGDRHLDGLVFTKTAMVTGAASKADFETNGKVISFTSASDVTAAFGSSSKESAFAVNYFAYEAPSGGSPRRISFAFIKSSETIDTAFERVSGDTNDFGSFCCLNTAETTANLKLAANRNARLDNTFLMVVVDSTKSGTSTYAGIEGLHVVYGTDIGLAYMPMAITATVDYDAANGTTCLMYKRFSGETPTVTKGSEADALNAMNYNFYGQTKSNGSTLDFYQRGFNIDGLDTAVYMNEAWLKSSIAAAFFNLMTSVERVPANDIGETMICSIVNATITKALKNGTIMPGKTLTAVQKQTVRSLSGDTTGGAEFTVEDNGYWLGTYIEPKTENGRDEYIAHYRLIYSKGDSIRKVEGYHDLV